MSFQRLNRRLGGSVLTATVVVVGVFAAFYLSDYELFQLSRVLTIGIAVLALNLLTGRTGQISVGHGALFGVGAYATAILMLKADFPSVAAVPAAAVVAFLCGAVLGLPALRIRGLNLALVTLAVAIVFPALAKHWSGLTGGVMGVTTPPPRAPFGGFSSNQWCYLVDLAVLLAAMLLVFNLGRGRIGRAMDAVRHNELMAAATGVRIGRVKTMAFAFSAGLAGLGGGLYQLLLGTATPDTYTFTFSLTILVASVVGGIRTLWGAVLGAAFVVYVPTETSGLGDSAPQFAYAIALLLAIYLLPGGVAQLPARLRSRFGAVRGPVPQTQRKVN
jgi:branched-chain amino acid transport system permease protein